MRLLGPLDEKEMYDRVVVMTGLDEAAMPTINPARSTGVRTPGLRLDRSGWSGIRGPPGWRHAEGVGQ
ncbi:hypothetical protein J5Y04_28685 [Kitasatospora sp. RG8]|uniref:hypothetical protein n=1 Tax=Kitasatospora sp. RG8 TaxID=2820815 RepID=UPI001ADF56CA|nr:hypothetical protein [Kitasatospora sp. RG8]MBP0453490.1 hypothetical protein [Kitasatospora sp. RG8]